MRELEDESVLVVARRSAGPGFTLSLGSGTHVFGSEPGGADLTTVAGEAEVPAADGPRIDVWELGTE